MNKIACRTLLTLCLAIACQSVWAQVLYRLKPLTVTGTPGCRAPFVDVFGFNENDEVAGNACNARGDYHAMLWRNLGTVVVDLGPGEKGSHSYGFALSESGMVTGQADDSTGEFGFLSAGDGSPMKKIPNGIGGSGVYPRAVNDLGQVTGAADAAPYGEHAFLWKNNGTPMRDLGTLGGGAVNSAGLAINAAAEIAGNSDPTSGSDGRENHAVLWKSDGTLVDLGTLGGYAGRADFINRSGQAAGNSASARFSRYRGFIWRNNGTPMHDIGSLGGAETFVNAFNDAGQIAGASDTFRWQKSHAFVWLNDGSRKMKDLGTLGGIYSDAEDLNASAQATGFSTLAGDTVHHAFLWRNDGTPMQDLNALVDPKDPLKAYVTLTDGHFINDKGDIVADGVDSRTNTSHQYVLQGTVLTLTPRSLAFGSVPIHTTSVAKSVTLTNTSPKVVAIRNIALAGPAAGQFSSTNNCGSSLVGHASCTIKEYFKPTTKGAKSAFLNVNGGGGGLRSVSLKGTGA